MQIFKTKQILKPDETDYILELVENNFNLEQKIDLLISSYQRLILDPIGFSSLIKTLCQRLELNANFPRRGDVNERFDVLIESKNDYKIVAEVEIPSIGILDAPRNLLDDIAVLVNRRGIEASKLIPLVICWDLPNNRTDYWNVVQDIRNVLNIQIKTCNILSLAILLWTENTFDAESEEYYLSSGGNELKGIIKILENQNIDPKKYPGFFSPAK